MEKKEEKFDIPKEYLGMFGSEPFDYKNMSSTENKSLFDGDTGMWAILLLALSFGFPKFYSDKEISEIDKRLSKVEGQIDILKERK